MTTDDPRFDASRVIRAPRGAERIKGAYAWRSFLHQGSPIACTLTW